MKKVKAMAVSVAAAVALTVAVYPSVHAGEPGTEGPGAYVYTNYNFNTNWFDPPGHWIQPYDVYNLRGPYDNAVSSIDTKGEEFIFYDAKKHQGTYFTLKGKISDLRSVHIGDRVENWNDRIKSVKFCKSGCNTPPDRRAVG